LENDRVMLTAHLPRIFWDRAALWQSILSDVDNDSSHPDTWDILADLVVALKARTVVEAGTHKGHAAMAMAEAMRIYEIDGCVYTADVIDKDADKAVHDAGLANFIQPFIGPFDKMLDDVWSLIDLAFIDASDHDNADLRLEYVELVRPRLAPHGVIVVDDATDDGWEGAKKLRDTCDLYLPVGHGIAIYQA
jgi:predicted O-methyltransferase YrrM